MLSEPNANEMRRFAYLFKQQHFIEAEKYTLELTARFPSSGIVWKALSAAIQQQGRIVESLAAMQKAADLLSNDAEIHNNLGNVLVEQGDLINAENCYRRALEISPNYPQAHHNLGTLLLALNRLEEAEKSYRQAIRLNPYYSKAHYQLASTLRALGRIEEAEKSYRQVIAINANDALAYNNLAGILRELGLFDESVKNYQHAINLKPSIPEIYSNLGNVLTELGQFQAAEKNHRRAIKLNPNYAAAYNNLGNTLINLGRLKEAENNFQQALEINPDCLKTFSSLLFLINHSDDYSQEFCLTQAKRFDEIATKNLKHRFTSWQCEEKPKRLRIGFVSGDFKNHPVSYFLGNVFAEIDATRFELIAYPTIYKIDKVTERLKTFFSEWKPIFSLNDEQAARLIHNDGIHVLFDLSGHTAHNRLPLFAWKPAPIQISWIGYPATTGLQAMDYCLVDADWSPEGLLDDGFVEKLVRLPTSAAALPVLDISADVVDTPALKKGYFTFGSFNRTSKLTSHTLNLWCNLLKEIPDSKMILGNVSDAELQKHLELNFTQRGVDVKRLLFYPRMAMPDYLALHGEIDLILDTVPYAGGTTSAFALWMGVPVLTYAWKTLAGRVGVAILSSVELQCQFVAESETEFIEIAKYWHKNVNELQILRHELRKRMQDAPKCKPENVAAGLEATLQEMWEKFAVQFHAINQNHLMTTP